MNAASRYPAISHKMRAMAHRFAKLYELEVSDLLQQLYIIIVENRANYDAGRGATRETYFINCLENHCKQERSRQRFGVELDRHVQEEDNGASELAQAEIAALREEEALTVDNGWRDLSDEDVDARLQSFTQQNRRIAAMIIRGKSAEEAADALGLTARRVRQVIREIVEIFQGGGFVPTQPTLF